MRRVVITGSQGFLGIILQEGLQDTFLLSCIDVKGAGEKILPLDIALEYDKFEDFIKNHDVLIHLAWDTSEDYPGEKIIKENKVMAENVYRAAVEAGVPRVIIASSVHAHDYSLANAGDEISATSESFPDTPYGATKNYIESLGRFYTRKYKLEVICIRFGGVNAHDEIRYWEDPLYGKVLLYRKDFLELIRQCILVKNVPPGFAILYGVSDNPGRVHSLENFLNWRPLFPKS